MKNNCPSWLRDTVIYSLYPQSFNDTNGDGIGDLNGITEKLEYIKDLGCNAVWMNPIFESHFLDAGYDVDDFYKIAPRYGTEEDFVKLCEKAHSLGMKVLLDLVAGHTSVSCEWFKSFADDENGEYKDRFIWSPEKSDKMFVENKGKRGGYYMYNYYDIQPAINYGFENVTEAWQTPTDHPAAVENQNELIRILDFWFKRGADGFRVDMASSLIKNDPEKTGCIRLWNRIRKWMDENYPENILISEWSKPDQSIPAGFHIDMLIHNTNVCLTALFRHEHFAHKWGDRMFGDSYFRKEAKGDYDLFLSDYLPFIEKTADKGYMSFITGSHDILRWSYGRDVEDLKVAYAFVMMMPGVPINYYGDEIGMRYLPLADKEGGRDRTGSRSPMQWDDGKNLGFSESDEPYLPVDDAKDAPTVKAQENDENSLLNFVKELIKVRKAHPALLADGDYETVESGYPLVFDRVCESERIRVVINASNKTKEYNDTVGEAFLCYNAKTEGEKITLGSRSVVIYKK